MPRAILKLLFLNNYNDRNTSSRQFCAGRRQFEFDILLLMERKKAVAAIVENDGKFLLGKKRSDSTGMLSGEWHIPGETVEGGESDREALARGIKEEAGIAAEIVRFICSHQTPKGTLVNWYLCKAGGVNLIAGSDLEQVRWVTADEVLALSGETARSLWPKEIQEMFGEGKK